MQPQKIGRYEILRLLGHGTSSVVWLGLHPIFRSELAVKEMEARALSDASLHKEAILLKALQGHPNIVEVYDAGIIGGKAVIIMEYVEGESLAKRLAREGSLPIDEALRITAQILVALEYMHKRGVIHSDIKPSNILLDNRGIAKLVDFGLAKILKPDEYASGAGTYAYRAPEDFSETPHSDHRKDIWSSGIVLFEMLTGSHPFKVADASNQFAWKRTLETQIAQPLTSYLSNVPAVLQATINRALYADKQKRFQSTTAFLAYLKQNGLYDLPLQPEEQLQIERFVTAFNRITDFLRNYLNIQDRSIGFPYLLKAYEQQNPQWVGGDPLRNFVSIRNKIIHEATEPNRYRSMPSEPEVKEIEGIAEQLTGVSIAGSWPTPPSRIQSSNIINNATQEDIVFQTRDDRSEDWLELPYENIVGQNFLDMGSIPFKDRTDHIAQLREWLNTSSIKLISIVGSAGIGKTALLSKLCTEIEQGQLRLCEAISPMGADGIIYISCTETNRLTLERIFHDFAQMLGPTQRGKIVECWHDAELGTEDKVRFLLSKIRRGCYVLALDNFECVLDTDSSITDAGIRTFIDLCLATPHALRILVTSCQRIAVSRQGMRAAKVLLLDTGLEDSDGMALLRSLDPEGELGLRDAPDELLLTASRRCFGIPHALESIAIILANSPFNLSHLLNDHTLFDEHVAQKLAAERYRRVKDDEWHVLEALAIYGHPATVSAVRFLLKPFWPGIDVDTSLNKLLHGRLVFSYKSSGTFELHHMDQVYISSRFHGKNTHYPLAGLRRQQVCYYVEESSSVLQKSTNGKIETHGQSTAMRYARQAIDVAENSNDDVARGWAYRCGGNVLINMNRFVEGLDMVQKASACLQGSEDKVALAGVLMLRYAIESTANKEFGHPALFAEAIQLVKEAQDTKIQAELWCAKATVAMRLKMWGEAEVALAEMERLASTLGSVDLLADHIQMQGELYALAKEWEKARETLEIAKSTAEKRGRQTGVCAATGWLGLAKCHLGQMTEGLTDIRHALEIERDILISLEGAAKWLHALGELFLERGEMIRALSALWLSRDLREEIAHRELPNTHEMIDQIREILGHEEYKQLEDAFEPRRSEFGEYAFLWGLGRFRKFPGNPILPPSGDGWEAYAIYNPAAWTDGEQVYLIYRAEGPSTFAGKEQTSRIGLATSSDGVHFVREPLPILEPTEVYEIPGGCEDPRIVYIQGTYYMTYTAFDGKVARLSMAVSKDLRVWEKWGPLLNDEQWERFFPNKLRERYQQPRGWSKSGSILPVPVNGYYWMYFGDTSIWVARSPDLRRWEVIDEPVLSPRPGAFDSRLVEPGPPPVMLPEGIWLGYNAADDGLRYTFGQALFEASNPANLIRRSSNPLLEPTTLAEMEGQVDKVVFGEGLVLFEQKWHLYYGMADSRIGLAIAESV